MAATALASGSLQTMLKGSLTLTPLKEVHPRHPTAAPPSGECATTRTSTLLVTSTIASNGVHLKTTHSASTSVSLSTSSCTSSPTRIQLVTTQGTRFSHQPRKRINEGKAAEGVSARERTGEAGELGPRTAESGLNPSSPASQRKLRSLQSRRNLKTRLALASSRASGAPSPGALPRFTPRHSTLGTPQLVALGAPQNGPLGSPAHSAVASPRFAPLGSPRHPGLGSPKLNFFGSRRHSPLGSPRHTAVGSPRHSVLGRRHSMFKPRRLFGGEREGEMEGAETSIEIRAGGMRTSVPVTFPPKLPVTLPMTPSPALPLTPSSFSAFALSLSLSFPFSFNLSPSFNCFVPVAVSLSLSLSPYSSGRGWQGSVETAVELSVGDAQFPFSVPMCMPHIGNTELMASIPFAAGAVALLGVLTTAAMSNKASMAH